MKNIEEKFEEYIKDNSMKRMYMSDYIKAGYEIAKKEIILEIEKRLKETSTSMSMATVIELVGLIGWIKSNDEKVINENN